MSNDARSRQALSVSTPDPLIRTLQDPQAPWRTTRRRGRRKVDPYAPTRQMLRFIRERCGDQPDLETRVNSAIVAVGGRRVEIPVLTPMALWRAVTRRPVRPRWRLTAYQVPRGFLESDAASRASGPATHASQSAPEGASPWSNR